jgi:Rha family phage regulatory protein
MKNSQEEKIVLLSAKGTPYTLSTLVAKKFDKRHTHVLRDIERLIKDLETAKKSRPKNGSTNSLEDKPLFAKVTYVDDFGRTQPQYAMTRDGFRWLAMRFTGIKALGFQMEFFECFDQLEQENARLKAELAAQQKPSLEPTEEMLRLAPYTDHNFQRERSKKVAGYLLEREGTPHAVVEHYRETFRLVTGGKTPTNYVRGLVKQGMRMLSQSGRGALRKVDPAAACTLALLDDQVRVYGRTLEEIKQAEVPTNLIPAFASLLRLGHTLSQLEIGEQPAPKLKA